MMRSTFLIGFLTTAFAVSLQAQHAGGGMGHATAHTGAGLHSFSTGFRPSTGVTGPPSTGFTGRPSTGFPETGASFYRRPGNSRPGGGGNSRQDRRRGYAPFLYGGYFSPYYSSFDSSFDYGPGAFGYPPDSGEQTAEVTANLLGEQVQRLSDQVEQLNAQQYSAPPPYAPAGYYNVPPNNNNLPASNPAPEPAPPAVTVVLRSGQKIQVQNYAIMGDSFWDFSHQPARRIPLANVDVAASTKATEAGGGQFPAL
jgi:hypothetical protein